jgi:dihydroxy-acid dehydratase
MGEIEEWLHRDCVGVPGIQVRENREKGRKAYEESGSDVICSREDPVMANGGIIVLRGNLADSAVVRAFKHSKNQFAGKAKVYETQEDAIAAVKRGEVKPGDALILRFMGPKGGPGMPDCFGVSSAVVGAGLEETVAVITDGRFSGFARGVGVCQICPEAADGGPLAKVKDGDLIVIDTEHGLLEDKAEDFASREAVPAPERREKGILGIYARIAGSAATGARL